MLCHELEGEGQSTLLVDEARVFPVGTVPFVRPSPVQSCTEGHYGVREGVSYGVVNSVHGALITLLAMSDLVVLDRSIVVVCHVVGRGIFL